MGLRPASVAGWIVKLALRVVWTSTMILTPLFGFWLASSLAAYRNASQWLALAGGLALFPILPLAWELFYLWRRRGRTDKPILTGVDRLILRTLVINGVFLAGMLWRAPETAFRAIAVRGDWILDGRDDDTSNQIRHVLLGLADRFERRWHKADDRYGHSDAAPDPAKPDPAKPDPTKPDPAKPDPTKPSTDTPSTDTPSSDPTKPSTDTPAPPPADPLATWPVPAEPEVAVSEMPDDAQASIAGAGTYLAQHFTEPRRLVKAIHDYVDLRLHYDEDALAKILAHDYAHVPSQEAEAVFAARTGVCEGYAKLMVALGKAAGIDISYVTGYIRDAARRTTTDGTDDAIKAALEGYAHAWNAVKIDGQTLLIDATWDDPKDDTQPISSTYLFTPPALFVRDHLPEDPAWQLLPTPVTPGEFVRQPLLTPNAGRLGLALLEPARSQVTADGALDIMLDNPQHAEVIATIHQGTSAADREDCTPTHDADHTRIHCKLPTGQLEIWLYAAPAGTRSGTYQGFGTILVNSR